MTEDFTDSLRRIGMTHAVVASGFHLGVLIIFAKIAHISFYSISSTHILLYIVFLLFILLDTKYAVQELTQTALTEFKGTSQYTQSVCLKDKYY